MAIFGIYAKNAAQRCGREVGKRPGRPFPEGLKFYVFDPKSILESTLVLWQVLWKVLWKVLSYFGKFSNLFSELRNVTGLRGLRAFLL